MLLVLEAFGARSQPDSSANMDHLPAMQGIASSSILVPYVGRQDHDGNAFQDCPLPRKWNYEMGDMENIIADKTYTPWELEIMPNDRSISGILHKISVQLHGTFLIPGCDYDFLVNARHLPDHITLWHVKMSLFTSGEWGRGREEAKSHQNIVGDTLASRNKHFDIVHLWPLGSAMALFIQIPLGILMESVDRIFNVSRISNTLNPSNGCHIHNHLETEMIKKGWCRSQIQMFARAYGESSLYLGNQLRRQFQRRHDACTRAGCVAFDAQDHLPVPKHITGDCCCKFLFSPIDKVTSIVMNASIPLIKICHSASNELFIDIVEYQENDEFVAISHVWSQGLGNSDGSLPECQIKQILDFVLDLVPNPGLFWLDTLCVPKRPPSVRKQAIKNINVVYQKASTTLVLDEELLMSDSSKSSNEDLSVRIMLSEWSRRLWTLMEAVLSRRIAYRFRDRAAMESNILAMWQEVKSSAGGSLRSHQIFATPATTILRDIQRLRELGPDHEKLALLLALLSERTTSCKEDETIFMARVLRKPDHIVNDIVRTKVTFRMRRFLEIFDIVPMELLFIVSPKMTETPFRWAPSSWIGSSFGQEKAISFELKTQYIHRVAEGVIVNGDALLLPSACDVSIMMIRRSVNVLIQNEYFTMQVYNCCEDPSAMHGLIVHGFAVCLDRSVDKITQQGRGRGVFVELLDSQAILSDKPTHARFLFNVHLWYEGKTNEIIASNEKDKNDVLLPVIQRSRLWCVK